MGSLISLASNVPPMIPRVGLFWPERLHQVLAHHSGRGHNHFAHEVGQGGDEVFGVVGYNGLPDCPVGIFSGQRLGHFPANFVPGARRTSNFKNFQVPISKSTSFACLRLQLLSGQYGRESGGLSLKKKLKMSIISSIRI